MKKVVYKIRKSSTVRDIINGCAVDELRRRSARNGVIVNRFDSSESAMRPDVFRVVVFPSDHNPPHFHVFIKNVNWMGKFFLPDGHLAFIDSRGRNNVCPDSVISSLKSWLHSPSSWARYGGDTNAEVMMHLWRSFHSV